MRPRWVSAEVAALADDAGAQLAAVDADRVVGAVADLGVRLVGGLDERADAAVPEQVDGRAQDRPARARRASSDVASTPSAARTSGESGDRLRGAREDAAARGDQRRGRSRPTTCRRPSANRRLRSANDAAASGVGIEEDVAVVEGGDQADLVASSSIPLPKTSPDMSPMPTTVNGARVDVAAELAEVPLARSPRRRAP